MSAMSRRKRSRYSDTIDRFRPAEHPYRRAMPSSRRTNRHRKRRCPPRSAAIDTSKRRPRDSRYRSNCMRLFPRSQNRPPCRYGSADARRHSGQRQIHDAVLPVGRRSGTGRDGRSAGAGVVIDGDIAQIPAHEHIVAIDTIASGDRRFGPGDPHLVGEGTVRGGHGRRRGHPRCRGRVQRTRIVEAYVTE